MPPIRHEHLKQARMRRLGKDTIWNIRTDKIVWQYRKNLANSEDMSGRSPARMSSSAQSPSSSPRLPSPPPLPELQLGPKSPSIQAIGTEIRLDTTALQDEGAHRRVRPGTRAADMAKGPPFVPLHQLDSPFQLQEYLKAAYCKMTRDENSETIRPMTKEMARELAAPPVQQDTGESISEILWLYELCRFLVQRTNRLIVAFFNDEPPCSSQTCLEMRASEWQYLCAVHDPPKSCCAIDYCCHTLDWAADILTSTKHFPSRLAIEGTGSKQLTNIFRRVYRIYAHAWYQHKSVFWSIEQEEGLYKFFKTVCEVYSLVPPDNYTVPAEAEGEQEDAEPILADASSRGSSDFVPREGLVLPTEEQTLPLNEPQTPAQPSQTTRKHRHTPSTGTQIESISEGAEEEESDPRASRQVYSKIFSKAVPPATKEPSPTKSPKPDMHMSLTSATKVLQQPAMVDATPRPEDHGNDPFDDSQLTSSDEDSMASSTTSLDSSSSQQTQVEVPVEHEVESSFSTEQSAQASMAFSDTSSLEQNLQPTIPDHEPMRPISAINTSHILPSINPSTPTQLKPSEFLPETPSGYTHRSTASDDNIVHSPGGGSIRTIDHDFLSGLIEHFGNDQNRSTYQASSGTSNDNESATMPSGVQKFGFDHDAQELQSSDAPDTQADNQTSTAVSGDVVKDEDPEDFGEIKLPAPAEPADTATQHGAAEDVGREEITPSGVVKQGASMIV